AAERAFNLRGALERGRRALRLHDRFPERVADADVVEVLQRVGTNKPLLGDPSGLAGLEAAVEHLVAAGAPPAEVAALSERVGWYLTVGGRRDAAGRHLARAEELGSGAPAVAAGVAVS